MTPSYRIARSFISTPSCFFNSITYLETFNSNISFFPHNTFAKLTSISSMKPSSALARSFSLILSTIIARLDTMLLSEFLTRSSSLIRYRVIARSMVLTPSKDLPRSSTLKPSLSTTRSLTMIPSKLMSRSIPDDTILGYNSFTHHGAFVEYNWNRYWMNSLSLRTFALRPSTTPVNSLSNSSQL